MDVSEQFNIERQICKIISTVIESEISSDDMDKKLIELGVNSMSLISILFEMENKLNVEVAEVIENLDSIDTIQELVNFVKQQAK